ERGGAEVLLADPGGAGLVLADRRVNRRVGAHHQHQEGVGAERYRYVTVDVEHRNVVIHEDPFPVRSVPPGEGHSGARSRWGAVAGDIIENRRLEVFQGPGGDYPVENLRGP